MTHALAADLGLRNLNAALVADDALETGALVLAAVTFPVLGGTKDALAVQTVTFRLEGTVVNGFCLEYFAVRPRTDLVGRSQTNLDGIQICQFKQGALSFLPVRRGLLPRIKQSSKSPDYSGRLVLPK